MKWIENYAWFGRKASLSGVIFYLGLIAAWEAPYYAHLMVIPMAIAFGFTRDTDAANNYWAAKKGGRGA